MPRSPRRRRRRDDITVFTIELTGPDLVRWHSIAQELGLTFEQLVKEAVDLVYARRSTR